MLKYYHVIVNIYVQKTPEAVKDIEDILVNKTKKPLINNTIYPNLNYTL